MLSKIYFPKLTFIIIFCCSFIFTTTTKANDDDSTIQQDKQKQSKQVKATPSSGFSVYGNWCGPDHPADVNNAAAPIDILDKQCKTHDLCYVDKGYLDCACDRKMVIEIDNTQHQRLYTTEQYLVAQNIKLHFAISPCNGEVAGNKMLPTRVLTNVYKGTKRRVLNTYDRFIGKHFNNGATQNQYESGSTQTD